MHNFGLAAVTIPQAEEYGKGNSLQNKFTQMVEKEVERKMEPYWKLTENPEYLKFRDCTEYVERSYEWKIDCFRLPQGTIIPTNMPPYGNRFLIRDGKVYEREAGPVHQPRRTKRAKRIRALPNYPLMKKKYPDLRTFADARFGFEYSEKEQAYGYYMNPNGMWTRFRIGGRWACLLLVKDDC